MKVRNVIEVESWEELFAHELEAAEAVEPDDFAFDSEWHEMTCERDPHRWELDPASAEDWRERNRRAVPRLAEPWRHFGH
jgi:hypothetical protein